MYRLKSPAKVNIGLWVVGKREDGYHNILSYVHKISLYDIISIQPSPLLNISTTNPNIPDNQENLVYKAVKEFENATGIQANFHIFIQKNIPIGAGLGGGSSNVATVLKFLNEYFNKPLTYEELVKLSSFIGSDVPLFFEDGLLKIEGKGDKITKLNIKLNYELFIIYPNKPSITKNIYSKVSNILTNPDKLSIIDSLSGDIGSLFDKIENMLGDIAKQELPVIQEVLNTLEFLGYEGHITGSGSSVFSIGKPNAKLEAICKSKNWKLYKVKFI